MPARLFENALPPQRIRTYLILFGIALTLPLLGIALFAFHQLTSLEEQELERRVRQVALDMAGDIDREIDRATVALEILATSPLLAQDNYEAFHDQARRAISPDRAGILLVDLSMQQLVNTRAPFGTTLPPTSDPDTARRVFATKELQVSNVFMGVVSRRAVVNIEVPVWKDASVRYVLIMVLDATRFEELLKSQRLEERWITGITDRNGIILARSERHSEFVGKPLPKELLDASRAATRVFRATSVAGVNILRATVRSQIAGWLVSATVPLSFADAARGQARTFGGTMVVTALLLGGALAYLFGAFMARPLDAVALAAVEIGQGRPVEPLRSPLQEANAVTKAMSVAATELHLRQEHTAFLMRELAHRAKNQLAVVKGMAQQTARHSPSVAQFIAEFSQRIQGLAQSQDLMLRQNWQGAWIRDLVRGHLDLFGVGLRAQMEGPELFLSADAVQNLGFALHELATNASKHGAIAAPDGRIWVMWHGPDKNGRVHIDWKERDGPPVEAPMRQGFGYLVVTKLVPQAVQGNAKLDFESDGVHWHMDFPRNFVLSQPPETKTSTP
jgi:two-component sensor histidine kinase